MVYRIVLGLLTVMLAVAIAALPVGASTTYSLYLMSQDEDRFWNYDFKIGGIGRPDKVDQAVTIVFFGNANKQKIESGFSSYFPCAAAAQMSHHLAERALLLAGAADVRDELIGCMSPAEGQPRSMPARLLLVPWIIFTEQKNG